MIFIYTHKSSIVMLSTAYHFYFSFALAAYRLLAIKWMKKWKITKKKKPKSNIRSDWEFLTSFKTVCGAVLHFYSVWCCCYIYFTHYFSFLFWMSCWKFFFSILFFVYFSTIFRCSNLNYFWTFIAVMNVLSSVVWLLVEYRKKTFTSCSTKRMTLR